MVQVETDAPLRQQVEIHAETEQPDPRVGEIGLTLFLRRAQRVQDAVTPGKRDAAATDVWHRLANPVAGISAGKQRILEHRVEAGGLVVERILVAATVEQRDACSHPVVIARVLERGKYRADVGFEIGKQRALFLAERVIGRQADIMPTEVPVAVVTEVSHVVLV